MNARLLRCGDFIPEELRAGEAATRAPEPDNSNGSVWVFATRTEAGRINENRDKLIVVGITERCDEANARINAPPRRRILGIIPVGSR